MSGSSLHLRQELTEESRRVERRTAASARGWSRLCALAATKGRQSRDGGQTPPVGYGSETLEGSDRSRESAIER